MVDVVVPQISEVASEIVLVRWLRTPGDRITKGAPLFELDTDKYVVEIEAFDDGVLAEILVEAGATVEPGQVVGRLQIADADDQGIQSETIGNRPARATAAADPVSPPARQNVLASPKARTIAKERGIDIRSVPGTGRGGVVTAADVLAATPDTSFVALSPIRQTIGARMQASKRDVPHFYLMVDVDMSEAVRLRTACVENLGWSRPPTFTDLIVMACARALRHLPEANVRLDDGGLRRRTSIDIGIAVSCDDGLRVPVIAKVDQLGLTQLSEAARTAAERAREGRMLGSDLGERSMVVSNLGMHRVDAFVAIVDQPDPMILATGQVAERSVVIDGAPAARWGCTLTLSADHRVFDGAGAAQFVVRVKDELESATDFVSDAA